mmetsp:Transcript_19787/g.49886  ORF Transcript_19787/g.49886 Transcript_19787/m.49886 type:complete len:356 (+) Transcript_19787:1654-2721(+)
MGFCIAIAKNDAAPSFADNTSHNFAPWVPIKPARSWLFIGSSSILHHLPQHDSDSKPLQRWRLGRAQFAAAFAGRQKRGETCSRRWCLCRCAAPRLRVVFDVLVVLESSRRSASSRCRILVFLQLVADGIRHVLVRVEVTLRPPCAAFFHSRDSGRVETQNAAARRSVLLEVAVRGQLLRGQEGTSGELNRGAAIRLVAPSMQEQVVEVVSAVVFAAGPAEAHAQPKRLLPLAAPGQDLLLNAKLHRGRVRQVQIPIAAAELFLRGLAHDSGALQELFKRGPRFDLDERRRRVDVVSGGVDDQRRGRGRHEVAQKLDQISPVAVPAWRIHIEAMVIMMLVHQVRESFVARGQAET